MENNNNNQRSSEILLINSYKNAISMNFETVINKYCGSQNKSLESNYRNYKLKNPFFYQTLIKNYEVNQILNIPNNFNVKEKELIVSFNKINSDLVAEITQFFIAVINYNGNNKKIDNYINVSFINIEDGFKKLSQFDIKISDYFTATNSLIAYQIKRHLLSDLKNSVYFLNNKLYVDIEKCPLKSYFDQLKCNLESSISTEEIDFLIKNKKVKKTELTFFNFINDVKDKELFANDLKESFKIEKNTEIAIVIHLLESERIFVYSYFAHIHRELKKFLGREIGNPNTLNDAVNRIKNGILPRTRSYDTISNKVDELINKHKIKLNS